MNIFNIWWGYFIKKYKYNNIPVRKDNTILHKYIIEEPYIVPRKIKIQPKYHDLMSAISPNENHSIFYSYCIKIIAILLYPDYIDLKKMDEYRNTTCDAILSNKNYRLIT